MVAAGAAQKSVSNKHSSLSLRETSLGDGFLLRPARPVTPEKFGHLGIRWPTKERTSYRGEVRVQLPGWIGDNRIWVGSFPTIDKVKRAIDTVLHFSGETPHHFVYHQGFFEHTPPEFEAAPDTEEFKSFLRRMVQKYAEDVRELPDRKPISEAPSPCNRISGRNRAHELMSDSETLVGFSATPRTASPSSPEAWYTQNFDESFSIAEYDEDNNRASNSSAAAPDDPAPMWFWPALATFGEGDVQAYQIPTFTIAWDSEAMADANNPSLGSITSISKSHFERLESQRCP